MLPVPRLTPPSSPLTYPPTNDFPRRTRTNHLVKRYFTRRSIV